MYINGPKYTIIDQQNKITALYLIMDKTYDD